jgi:hypothetical protein
MLSVGEDVEADALSKRGWTISAIARHLGRDRKTARTRTAYVASMVPFSGGRAQRFHPRTFGARPAHSGLPPRRGNTLCVSPSQPPSAAGCRHSLNAGGKEPSKH